MAESVIIGLTGQSGAGKTAVCEIFKQNGYETINADLIAREVTAAGSLCLNEIAQAFGKKFLESDGSLNRHKLGEQVFGDKEMLKQLNAITYPYITYNILQKIKAFKQNDVKYILLDAPTLFESRVDDFCDLIISVTATERNRLKRIAERDGLTYDEIQKRFSSQRSERFFINHSDFIIKNNKSYEALTEKTQEVADKIKEYYETRAEV